MDFLSIKRATTYGLINMTAAGAGGGARQRRSPIHSKLGFELAESTVSAGPCPVCEGTDRFSINTRKQVWNCRGCRGGKVISLVQHLDGCTFPDAVSTGFETYLFAGS